MGYSHHWIQDEIWPIPLDRWQHLCADVRKLFAVLPAIVNETVLALAYEHDERTVPPQVDDAFIRFNGIGPAGEDYAYETFLLERCPGIEAEWQRNTDHPHAVTSYCKTKHRPYDLAVCAVLIVAKVHAPEHLQVYSDGDIQEWMPAWRWVREVLGEGYDLPAEFIADNVQSPYWLKQRDHFTKRGDTVEASRFQRYLDKAREEHEAYLVEREQSRLAPALTSPADPGLAPILGSAA